MRCKVNSQENFGLIICGKAAQIKNTTEIKLYV